MAAMKRIPKFTAGMFKKKMPRFGASGIRMPSMPKPPKPRVKKYAEGGETEIEEVIIGPGAAQQEYADEFAQSRKRREERAKQAQKRLVKDYLSATKRAAEKPKPRKQEEVDQELLRKQFDALMEDRKRREREAESQYLQEMKRGIRTARSGGKMESCCRGDGVAQRGKTRGKFV